MIRSFLTALTLAMSCVLGAAPAWGQADSTPSAQSPQYSEAELKSFAAAAVEVHRINSGYLPKMAEAAPDEQKVLEQQALRETTAAVEKQGLTSDRYDQILNAAQTQTEVAQKVEQYLKRAPRPGTTEL
jgi:uncharacterized protein DUF4168